MEPTDPTSSLSVADFMQSSERARILKFGASWCAPCRRVKPLVEKYVDQLPSDIYFMDVDVDADGDAYTSLKSKRIIGGLPSIVLYGPTNTNIMSPDFVVTGTSPDDIHKLFVTAVELSR